MGSRPSAWKRRRPGSLRSCSSSIGRRNFDESLNLITADRVPGINLDGGGQVALFAVMVIVFATWDYALLQFPLAWSYDLISLYLMVALFFRPCRPPDQQPPRCAWTSSSVTSPPCPAYHGVDRPHPHRGGDDRHVPGQHQVLGNLRRGRSGGGPSLAHLGHGRSPLGVDCCCAWCSGCFPGRQRRRVPPSPGITEVTHDDEDI